MNSSPEQETPFCLLSLSARKRRNLERQRAEFPPRPTRPTRLTNFSDAESNLPAHQRILLRDARRTQRSIPREDDSIRSNVTSPSTPSKRPDHASGVANSPRSKIDAQITALKTFAPNSVTKDTLGLGRRKRLAETSESELRASLEERPTNTAREQPANNPRRLATLHRRAFVSWQNRYFASVSKNGKSTRVLLAYIQPSVRIND